MFTETEPAAWPCALPGNRSSDLLVHGLTLHHCTTQAGLDTDWLDEWLSERMSGEGRESLSWALGYAGPWA